MLVESPIEKPYPLDKFESDKSKMKHPTSMTMDKYSSHSSYMNSNSINRVSTILLNSDVDLKPANNITIKENSF